MSSGTNTERIFDFNTDSLFRCLDLKKAPVMEFDLLKEIAGITRLPGNQDGLFRLHFSLYHHLYLLKSISGESGYYLHLDPMRIRLIKVPESGSCRHYHPEDGNYCGSSSDDSGFCAYHLKKHTGEIAGVIFDPLLDFYLNTENIEYGKSPVLKKLMRGVVIYALKRGEVDSALAFFGLSKPDWRSVKTRYRELAQKYHPDMMGGDESMMKSLNRSYQVLKETIMIVAS
jgi:hypothetical protein